MAETLKKWEEISRSYRVYIKLEKRLSENTVESYMRDLRQFAHFILRFYDVPPRKVEAPMIERYLALLYDQGREKTSQARALSGIRSFYNYLMLTDVIDSTPTQFIDTPKFGRHLPDILTVEEIDRIVAAVDTSTVKGRRDSAMLEVLYSCGLRVSELTSLRLGDLFFGEGYIRVTGGALPYGQTLRISGLRVFGNGECDRPAQADTKAVRVDALDGKISWQHLENAQGCNVRYGIAPDKLYQSWLVYNADEVTLSTLIAEQDYYVCVDSFNENGITTGNIIKMEG